MRLLSAAQTMGIHTALDTNGALGERLSDDELGKIDLVLLDIKGWAPERHKMLTGMDINPVLNFASRLSRLKRPVWLRFVLVPGLTDNSGDIEQLAGFAAGLGNIQRVDVLPFHQLGKFKWKELKLNYQLEDVSPPSSAQVNLVRDIFSRQGLKAY
jgi:pyruvate formate lyase activating enzyme